MVRKLAAGAKPRGRPRKKRKGRPPRPTAPAAVRSQQPPPTPPPSLPASRRSLRQRRPRRVEDYADYDDVDDYYFEDLLVEGEGDEDVIQEDDDDEEAEWKRREKKFKLLQKLPNHSQQNHSPAAGGDKVEEVRNGTGNRGGSAGASSSSSPSEDDDAGGGTKTLRKRKTPGHGGGSGGDNCDVGVELRSDGSRGGNPELEDGRRNAAPRSSGTTSARTVHDCPTSTPLPDKKMLQAILDKLQKKDIYGVFAEPVDPEELLDYHEIIEHPMDFGTIRKKLSTGGYANLEQFESDVFLICTNAMEYNAPDTIYFRQARSIQEQARKKFQNIRFESDDALKSEQNTQSNSVTKEPIKSFLCKVAPHLAGSHIPSAATLNSTGDACTGLDAVQAGPSELPVVELMDGSLTCENKSDKGEEKSVKSSPIKLGRKPIMLDEDHRTTYNASIEQPDILSDSAFSTFENEQKHLVAVGLDAEYSYARSLARFAATLGPIAWRIASEKIEKALPTGVKFGPGWVGEYEPLPTPILFFESHSQQQSDHNTQIQPKGGNWRDRTKDERKCTQSAASRTVQLCRPRVPPDSLTIGVMDGKANHLKELSVCSEPLEKRPRFFGFKAGSQHITSNAMSLQHNSLAMTSANEYGNTKVLANVSGKTILQNSPGMMSTVVDIAARRLEKRPEVANLVSQELISSSKDNIQPEVLKLPDMVAYCPESASSCTETRGMPNGKGVESLVWSSRPSPSLGFITPKQIRAGTDCLNQGGHVQAIDDPVELLRLMSGWVPSKVISSNSLLTDNQKQVMTSVSSPRSNSSAAASAAACAWMSVGRSSEHKSMEPSNLIRMQAGAASPGNLTSEYLVSTSRILEDGKKRPMPPVSSLPIQAAAEESFVQNNGLTGFPQLIMAQLSRFHGQTPWRGLLPHVQQKQKKDMQPPDLNISFHSPGSPIKQSGVLVDSQQPDLALQL